MLLKDAAHLQKEDAEYLNRKGLTKHKPALPLFDDEDVERGLEALRDRASRPRRASCRRRSRSRSATRAIFWARPPSTLRRSAKPGASAASSSAATWAASTPCSPRTRSRARTPTTWWSRAPTATGTHPPVPVQEQLEGVLTRTFARGGVLLIPAFAVGRAQQMIYLMDQLVSAGRMRPFPIHLDSPMAMDATRIYAAYPERPPGEPQRHRRAQPALRQVGAPPPHPRRVRGAQQAEGPRGHHLVDRHALGRTDPPPLPGAPAPRREHAAHHRLPGAREPWAARSSTAPTSVRIHKSEVPVLAEVRDLKGMSGHADAGEMLRWLSGVKTRAPDGLRDPRRGGGGRGPRRPASPGSAASRHGYPRTATGSFSSREKGRTRPGGAVSETPASAFLIDIDGVV